MIKKHISFILLGLCAMLIPIQGAFGAGASVDPSTLQMTLPAVQYLGTPYYVTLDYDAGKSGPSGLFWRFNSIAPSTLPGQCSGTVDPSNLNITNLCVLFVGMQFQVTLEFQSADATWKLGGGLSQLPGVIASVSGSCLDPEDPLNDPVTQCIIGCGTDTSCIANCISGLTGAFNIALNFNNPTAVPVEFVIPPGSTFAPSQSDVQTLMVLQEIKLQIQAGNSRHCIDVYCLNADLTAPASGDSFATAGGVNRPCLIEILNLTAGKTLSLEEKLEIQAIVWDCIDFGAISTEQRQFLEGL